MPNGVMALYKFRIIIIIIMNCARHNENRVVLCLNFLPKILLVPCFRHSKESERRLIDSVYCNVMNVGIVHYCCSVIISGISVFRGRYPALSFFCVQR